MKPNQSATSTSPSSVKSSTTATSSSSSSMDQDRDSCYYPGCKKNANCNCEICLASINATLDLMPLSIKKSSLTKLSSSRPTVESTPISLNQCLLSTPVSYSLPRVGTPVLKSTARLNFSEKKENSKKDKKKEEKRVRGFGRGLLRFFLGLSLLFVIEIGFSSWVLRPDLSNEIVRKIGEKSFLVTDFSGKLRFLQNEIKSIVDEEKVLNCSSMDSLWKIDQDGLLLNSRCVLYKSVTEEVSVWGWSLQTAGMLKTGFSSRSFTVLSGRVTEWSNGMIGYSVRKANSSWIHRRWGSSVVQLDRSTWVLEYRQSSILDCSSFSSAVAELFKFWISGVLTRIHQEFRWLPVLVDTYTGFRVDSHIVAPT